METILYRIRSTVSRPSWRPCSLIDRRGPKFPEDYEAIEHGVAESFEKGLEEFDTKLGDLVVFVGKEDIEQVYVAAPFGFEIVKFGREWKSPDSNHDDAV